LLHLPFAERGVRRAAFCHTTRPKVKSVARLASQSAATVVVPRGAAMVPCRAVDPLPVRRKRLATSPLCRGLNETELDEVLSVTQELLVKSGGHVFKQGDLADGLFFIARGRVEVSKDGQALATLGIGEVLGELSVLGGGHKRSASAKAQSETLVLRISTKDFRKLLEHWNVAAMKVTVNLAYQLTERLVTLNDKMLELTKAQAKPAASHLHSWKL
jgi:CRP-like cAMP-binding protein